MAAPRLYSLSPSVSVVRVEVPGAPAAFFAWSEGYWLWTDGQKPPAFKGRGLEVIGEMRPVDIAPRPLRHLLGSPPAPELPHWYTQHLGAPKLPRARLADVERGLYEWCPFPQPEIIRAPSRAWLLSLPNQITAAIERRISEHGPNSDQARYLRREEARRIEHVQQLLEDRR